MVTPVEQLIKDTANLEPGDIHAGDYIRKPEAETDEAPSVPGSMITDLKSAGYTTLYDTETRESSLVNNNMLATQLKVKRIDGSLVFTRVQPAEGPWRGNILCFLHEDQPERAKYAAMGFSACRKSSLPNRFQAANHARNKHRYEWKAVEDERAASERREDRQVQRELLRSVTPARAVTVATESEPLIVPESPIVVVEDPIEQPLAVKSGQCGKCDWKSDAKRSASRKMSLKRHIGSAHKE